MRRQKELTWLWLIGFAAVAACCIPLSYLARRRTVVLGLLVLGCARAAEEVVQSSNGPVEKLFTVDGCTIYRFADDGRDHHFARCAATLSVEASWLENCGKNCTRRVSETIPTFVVDTKGRRQ